MRNKIKKEFENLDRMKIFEIGVIDKRTNKNEYIIFHISIEGNKFIATHEATTHAEEKSNKIAYVSTIIEAFSFIELDEYLQNIYEECINKISKSDFFTLIND